ncbi:hypothetical protein MFOOBP_25505 [Escherichia coli]|nr:hypothetical protein MFOOBP_25505 [Escherichia coli]
MQLRSPARWADSHIDMYVACVIRGLCSSAGRWSYGVVSPVTGRVRPLAQYSAATRAGRRSRAQARRPLRTTVGDVRQLRGGGLGYGFAGGAGPGDAVSVAVSAICGRCPFKSGVVAFHALTGIRK